MSEPQVTTIEYASGGRSRTDRLTVVDYLLQVAAAATLVGVIVASVLNVGRYKKLYMDFGLKLPTSTQFLLDVYDAFVSVRAQYWLWLLPAIAPLLLSRMTARNRNRLLLVAVCLAGFASAYCSWVLIEPMNTIMTGLTNTGGSRP